MKTCFIWEETKYFRLNVSHQKFKKSISVNLNKDIFHFQKSILKCHLSHLLLRRGSIDHNFSGIISAAACRLNIGLDHYSEKVWKMFPFILKENKGSPWKMSTIFFYFNYWLFKKIISAAACPLNIGLSLFTEGLEYFFNIFFRQKRRGSTMCNTGVNNILPKFG